jgi:predicted unusual protein kinase regulating ubiquinone biosynthesis (AarF/ABC1/UbiB family)
VFNDDTPDTVKQRASELRALLTRLGPSYIKAGQVLANRPDLMRADYMNELVILQDDVPAFPTEQARRIIEKSMGQPIDSVFSSFSEIPIAAASLGQVPYRFFKPFSPRLNAVWYPNRILLTPKFNPICN